MERYELIKTYPGSPKLGYVTPEITETRQFVHIKRQSIFSTEITENPEFWRVYKPIIKAPEPMFVTEDFVEIFPGDSWWYVKLSNLTMKQTSTLVYKGTNTSGVKRFSDQRNAMIFVQTVNAFSKNHDVTAITKPKMFTVWECVRWANFTGNREIGTGAIKMDELVKLRDEKTRK